MNCETRLYRCENGHLQDEWFFRQERPRYCAECNSLEFVEVTKPDEIMWLAERLSTCMISAEAAHRMADAAVLLRLRKLDPELVARYERIRERLYDHNHKGFGYSL